jgi:hypothetical protein
MFFPKLKTVPSTALSHFVSKTDSAMKKKVYVAALKRASDSQNLLIDRVAPRARRLAR